MQRERNVVGERNNSQHCQMLHVAPVCTPCCFMPACLLLRVVAQIETGQTFCYMLTDAATPKNAGSCVLSVCAGLKTALKVLRSRRKIFGHFRQRLEIFGTLSDIFRYLL